MSRRTRRERARRPTLLASGLPVLCLAALAASAARAETPRTTGQAAEAAALPDLSGRWIQKHVTTGVSEVPVVGSVVTVNRVWLLVEVEQRGDQLTLREEVCRVDVRSSVDLVETSFPPGFAKAVSGNVRRATLVPRDAGFRFDSPWQTVVQGASLGDARHEPLPEQAEDGRITDPDGDGKPGLTVTVKGLGGLVDGEIYVVMRGRSRLLGDVDPTGRRISGGIAWRTEQSIVDASNAMLGSAEPDNKPHRNPQLSYFDTRRAPEGMTCRRLVREGNRLFPREKSGAATAQAAIPPAGAPR